MKSIASVLFSSISFSISLFAGQQQPPAPHIATGPAVGSPVPDFRANDQDGRAVTLSSTLGPKGALLVFFRSADW